MRHNINVSVYGTTRDDSGKEVSNMSVNFSWDYDPVGLLKLVNDNLPAFQEEIGRFIAQIVLANSHEAPKAESPMPDSTTPVEEESDEFSWLQDVVIPPKEDDIPLAEVLPDNIGDDIVILGIAVPVEDEDIILAEAVEEDPLEIDDDEFDIVLVADGDDVKLMPRQS